MIPNSFHSYTILCRILISAFNDECKCRNRENTNSSDELMTKFMALNDSDSTANMLTCSYAYICVVGGFFN